jgi:hypothetical protein
MYRRKTFEETVIYETVLDLKLPRAHMTSLCENSFYEMLVSEGRKIDVDKRYDNDLRFTNKLQEIEMYLRKR